ncbi:MAG: hypothetical protein AAB362_02145 [Patescibacteria group bacterium]
MQIPKIFFKIIIILAFVVAVPSMIVGMNFWMLNPPELMRNCLLVKNALISSVPCDEIAVPAISSLVQLLGFLIVLTTAYALYFINDRLRKHR